MKNIGETRCTSGDIFKELINSENKISNISSEFNSMDKCEAFEILLNRLNFLINRDELTLNDWRKMAEDFRRKEDDFYKLLISNYLNSLC